MQEKATGLILRIRPLTETSLIVHWLTEEIGRIATVAKGARRPKSPFRGKLDLFYLHSFSFQRSRRSELHTLHEVELKETHPALRTSIENLQQSSYAAALIEQVTETESPIPELYLLFREFLAHLASSPPGHASMFAFEMKLLEALGLQPDLSETKLSEGSRKILEQYQLQPWGNLSRLRLTANQEGEIHRFFHDYLLFHLGRVPSNRPPAGN
ncbi:MAG: DNA repair protein RecO [Limisphaerales bacterium]